MAPRNTLSNLAKRQIAYSGQADIGDVPELYALREAMQRQGEAEMGGTPGLGETPGGVVPFGSDGGGVVGGTADSGLPGDPLMAPGLEEQYTREYRRMGGDAPDRGEIASRGAINLDPADPFGVQFGEQLETATGLLAKAETGMPVFGMMNKFVQLALMDAQYRSDKFFESLATGENIDFAENPGGPISITRRSPSGGDAGEAAAAAGVAAGMAGADIGTDLAGMGFDSGSGGGGDAGSGSGGGGGGSGGMGCFAAGTPILMADGGTRPIELIALGDKVMAFREDEEPEPREVIGCYAHARQPVVRLNGSTLVTRKHRFFALIDNKGHGFWPIEEIPLGARIMGADGSSIVVETIEDAGEIRDVFNFTVDDLHTYIAGGYRVHNIKHMGGYVRGDSPGAEVRETLVDGEYVLSPEATSMLGKDFLDGANTMARLARRR